MRKIWRAKTNKSLIESVYKLYKMYKKYILIFEIWFLLHYRVIPLALFFFVRFPEL